jgi:hypothetical protein
VVKSVKTRSVPLVSLGKASVSKYAQYKRVKIGVEMMKNVRSYATVASGAEVTKGAREEEKKCFGAKGG